MSHLARLLPLLLAASAALPARAAPRIASPGGDGEGRWALGVGAAMMLIEEAPVPFVRLEAAGGLSEHVDLIGELDTIGIGTIVLVGPRAYIGDRVAVAVSARVGPGLVVYPEVFRDESPLHPLLVAAPGAALALRWDGGAATVGADLLVFLGDGIGSASLRTAATLELDVARSGAVSFSGAVVLDGGEDRALPVVAVGWVW